MSYQINRTDGTILTEVADGQTDQISTGLTLIGKNFSGFGEALNENLVHLLENFSGSARPKNPIRGQMWYDTSEAKVKVYNGRDFVPVSSATVANTQPTEIGIGDLWYNDVSKQLYFYDGNQSVLLGPSFSASQGLSGFRVESILDSQNQTRVVTTLYTNGVLLGIFSKDRFIPSRPIQGFSENDEGILIFKEIFPGFNQGSYKVRQANPTTGVVEETPLIFKVTAENANNLGGLPASLYVRSDTSNLIEGQLQIQSNLGITLGDEGLVSFSIVNGDLILANNKSQRDIKVTVKQGETPETAISILTPIRTIDVYPDFSDSQVRLGGSLIINGDLTVQGSTTTVNTENLVVQDKSIELATVETPTDEIASGGGIILKGDTDKIIIWSEDNESYQLSNETSMDLKSYAWNFSEHINLADNKFLYLNDTEIFRKVSEGKYALTADVVALDGVTQSGKQNFINIGPGVLSDPAVMKIENNEILILEEDQDLILSPNGEGNIILTGQPRIEGLADPELQQDAATKEYVDDVVETRSIVLSINLEGAESGQYIADEILTKLAPVSDYRVSTIARVLCTTLTNTAVQVTPTLATTTGTFLTNLDGTSSTAVAVVAANNLTIPAQPMTVIRVVKVFVLTEAVLDTKTWVYRPDLEQTINPL